MVSRPVYSTNFMTVQPPDVVQTFLVPPGDTAIVTHMTAWCPTVGPYGFPGYALTVALDYGNAFIWMLPVSGLAIGTYQWVGREVFLLSMTMNRQTPCSSFRANGYLLTAT